MEMGYVSLRSKMEKFSKRFELEQFLTNVSVLTNSIIVSDNVRHLHMVRTNAIKSKRDQT